MSDQRRFCPNVCGGDEPTGRYVCFCPSIEERRACHVYECTVCGEFFALTYDGMFYPVPDEAVAA